MIEPKTNQNLLNTQNYQLLSSYPNNLNYKYKNDTPFNPKNKEQNSIQNDYKYIPNNEINNNPKNLFPNILACPNDKNISLTSQISQEIDRQKLKFDEMVEKAKNINNSELFEFDLKKYLPKDNFENSKTFRKYKDLIKPNINSNRNNFFNKKK
jgi:membrane-bound lytic murein transglycosylase